MDRIIPAKVMDETEEIVRPFNHEDGICSVMDELVRTRTINSQAEYDKLYEERHTPNAELAAGIDEYEKNGGTETTIEELKEFVDSVRREKN